MKLRVVDTDARIAQQVTPENSVFSQDYPELSKFLYKNFDNVRHDYAIAMFNVEKMVNPIAGSLYLLWHINEKFFSSAT